MPKQTSHRGRRNPNADLIHLLNQRYHDEWRRAEAIQDELNCIRGSGFWKAVSWMRAIKQRLWPIRPSPEPQLAARAIPFDAGPGRVEPRGMVSIIIPFKDQVDLLRNCLRSLFSSTYRRFEIILVDNGSVEPRTVRFLSRLQNRKRLKVIEDPGEFNFSRLCNAGAAKAAGDFLLFLNNDTEVLARSWLDDLLQLAMNPCAGAIGGTLLYPNRTLQHVGLFPRTDGSWIHPYRGEPEETPGETGELRNVRSVPAVTAACLLIRRDLFLELNGFDERYPVAHNDVDLCERIRQKGMLILISPQARLVHYECLSRGVGGD